jgi:hypothetical protein
MRLAKKETIVKYLEDIGYRHGFDFWAIAFRIKMDGPSSRWDKGQSPQLGIVNDPRFDDRWEEWLEKSPWFFEACCEDALSGIVGKHPQWNFLDGHPDPSLALTRYVFYTTGHSGGWLVLDEWESWRFFRRSPDWAEWDYSELWRLYKFCQEVQNIVDHRYEEFEYLYGQKRQDLEAEWAAEEEETVALAEENVSQVSPIFV